MGLTALFSMSNCSFFSFSAFSILPVWGPPTYLWLRLRSDTSEPNSRCRAHRHRHHPSAPPQPASASALLFGLQVGKTVVPDASGIRAGLCGGSSLIPSDCLLDLTCWPAGGESHIIRTKTCYRTFCVCVSLGDHIMLDQAACAPPDSWHQYQKPTQWPDINRM